MEVAQVNLPVGLLIWVMIIPMLLKVDFGALHQVQAALARHRRHAVRQLGGQAVLDGAARLALHPPRVRALAAGRPARQLRRRPDPAGRRAVHGDGVRLEPADRRRSAVHAVAGGAERHHHGVRLRAHRRRCCSGCRRSSCRGTRCSRRWCCTSSSPSSWRSCWRKRAAGARPGGLRRARWQRIGPWSIAALLATLVLLFAFQGEAILRAAAGHRDAGRAHPDPGVLQFRPGLLAQPARLGETHSVACPSALIGASNFFELAVAAAISLFGFQSGAALATVVGRADRSAGDAAGGAGRQLQQGLVRARGGALSDARELLGAPGAGRPAPAACSARLQAG